MYPKSPFLRHPLVESQLIKRNPDLVADLLPWLCETPAITTYRVNLLRTTYEAFKARLDKLLADKYERPPAVYGIAELPEVICIAPLPDSCQEPPAATHKWGEVMVDRHCGAALLRGAHLYAPGVLSMLSGTQLNEPVDVYVDLAGKCLKGTCTKFDSPAKLFIGSGSVRMQRHQLFNDTARAVAGVAVEMSRTISGVPVLGDLSGPEALLQNLPSIVCGRVLAPQPGEWVLDMCSSPGNKTSHLAELMGDRGVLVALDKTPRKIAAVIDKCCTQNALQCVRPFAFDSTRSHGASGGAGRDSPSFQPPFSGDTFDRILLDAPCSALGNRPLLASDMTPKTLQSYVHVQRKLLDNAVALLRPHGVLVYSTCTVTEAENEAMVEWALRKHPQLILVEAAPLFGGPGLPGCGLDPEQRMMVQRFGPAATNRKAATDTVGFFIAKFVKRGPEPSPPLPCSS